MKKTLISAITLLAGSLLAADTTPKDDVIAAAKKLGQESNYSWKTVVVVPDGARFHPGPSEGKTEKDGFTKVTGTFRDNPWSLVRKGEKVALSNPDGGWDSLADLEKEEGPARFRGMMARNLKVPAVQATDLVATTQDLKKDGDVYSGAMTEAGAKSLLTFRPRDGGEGPTVTNATGSAKFWLKDGALAKYEFKVKGTVNINGDDIQNDRTTTVEIKDVGSTKIEVPDEAKKKLE
jgi:hypothetical protein